MLTHHDIFQLHQQYCPPHSGVALYGLADHAGMPGLVKMLTMAKVRWVSLFDGSKEANALSVAPILFAIDADEYGIKQRALLNWIGEHGTYTSSLSLVASPLAMPEMVKRLALRLNAVLPDRMDVMLRFFDPRIVEQLMLVLLEPQKQAFLGLCNAWCFLDRSGRLQHFLGLFMEQDAWPAALDLSVSQQNALIDACEPDQVVELLRGSVPTAYNAVAPPARHGFITRTIAVARSFGIDVMHELAFFCALALLYGESFPCDPQWMTVLEEVKGGRLTLQQAAESLEENGII